MDLPENPPALLRRARQAAGLSIEAFGKALAIYPQSVMAWESEWAVT